MKYRIEYAEKKCCDYANNRAELLKRLKLLKDDIITDIRKVYKSGATDSVMEQYKSYMVSGRKGGAVHE